MRSPQVQFAEMKLTSIRIRNGFRAIDGCVLLAIQNKLSEWEYVFDAKGMRVANEEVLWCAARQLAKRAAFRNAWKHSLGRLARMTQ
jgi:hypothetical protein